MTRQAFTLLLSLSLLLAAVGCGAPVPATPTPEQTPTAEAPTATATVDPPTATAEPTATATPEPSATVTPEPSATPTLAPTETAAPSRTPAGATVRPPATATTKPSATPRPSPSPLPPTATATPRPQAKRALLGYYVPYDSTSWASLQSQAGSLDYVALQVATLDYCGNVSSKEDRTLKAFARSRGLPVLASLFTSSEPLNHSVLTNPTSTNNAIQKLVSYVVEEGYDGLDIDVEGVPAGDRSALTSFVARLSAALHQRGKLVFMAVPAKTREVTTGWAGAYDYAALAPHLDMVVIMSYAYTTASSAPGSTAPYDWVERVAAYSASQFGAEKVLLGVAFYGYDWNTTLGGRAKALRYPQAAALAAAYGASIHLDPTSRSATFTYQAKAGDGLPYEEGSAPLNHDVVNRPAPACPLGPPPVTPVPRTPTPTPIPPPLQNHVVWLEDAASVAKRLEIADKYGVRGVAAWRLGQEDPAVWPTVRDWKQ